MNKFLECYFAFLSRVPFSILLKFIFFLLIISSKLHPTFLNKTRMRMQMFFKNHTNEEVQSLCRSYLYHISYFIAEFIHSQKLNDKELAEKIKISFPKEYYIAPGKEKVIICYTGHFINHELLTSIPILFPNVRMLCLYKSEQEPSTVNNTVIKRIRELHGARCIPANKNIYKTLLSEIRESANQGYVCIIGVLNDISTEHHARKNKFIFRNEIVYAYSGMEDIGKKLNATFMYAKFESITDGHYSIKLQELQPVSKDGLSPSYTQSYLNQLEQNIEDAPETWMLWGAKSIISSIYGLIP